MKDRRQPEVAADLPAELVSEARTQLQREIVLIEGWLGELEETSKDNVEAQSARKSYEEMIRNRRDLLETLNQRHI